MLTQNWTLGKYKLSLGESLLHIDKKYGELYKCVDQFNTRHLIRVMNFSAYDDLLMKYYHTECQINVFYENI